MTTMTTETNLPAVVRTSTKRPKFYRVVGTQMGATDGQMWAWVDDASSKPGHASTGHGTRSSGQYAWPVAEILAKLAAGKLIAVEVA